MIKSLAHLEVILVYQRREMDEILLHKEDYYYHFAKVKGVEKGVTKLRHFHPSRRAMRDLHNRLQTRLFSKHSLPPHIQGCTKGRSNMTNAKAHKGKKFKFHTDLKSYFDFVSNRKVYDALVKLGYSQKVSHLLTKITTFEGHLPQGPPTSPFLANVAGLDMDEEMLALCKKYGITYTRYVDDLCMSSQSDFQHIIPEIVAIIEKFGFFIGYKKTAYKVGKMDITGGNVRNNGIRPMKKHLEKYIHPDTPDHTRKGLDSYFAGLKKQ